MILSETFIVGLRFEISDTQNVAGHINFRNFQ